jgi:hypothetical protein
VNGVMNCRMLNNKLSEQFHGYVMRS